MIFDPQRPKIDLAALKAASWLPVYLIGMGIISWLGQYSGRLDHAAEPDQHNLIPLWWDLVVIAPFSLGIYFWAMAARLPREEMLALVEAQAAERTCLRRPSSPQHGKNRGTPPPPGGGVLRVPNDLSTTRECWSTTLSRVIVGLSEQTGTKSHFRHPLLSARRELRHGC